MTLTNYNIYIGKLSPAERRSGPPNEDPPKEKKYIYIIYKTETKPALQTYKTVPDLHSMGVILQPSENIPGQSVLVSKVTVREAKSQTECL